MQQTAEETELYGGGDVLTLSNSTPTNFQATYLKPAK
jgi:hypothetical protein